MRVVEIPRFGAPDVLTLREKPDPKPEPDQVVIRVRAIGVNFADIMARMGLYPDAPPIPFVPGYEVAGLDPDNRRVVAATKFNGYATRVVVRREQMLELPESVSFEQGAALAVNYLTAWVALVKMARTISGDRVLVEQGAGGVGLAALQIARSLGASVYSVVGSDDKARFVRERGATPIVRDRDAWPENLNVILDPSGMSQIDRDIRHLAAAGRLVLFGASEFATGRKRNMLRAAWLYLRRTRLDPVKMMNENYGVYGLNLLTYWGRTKELTEGFSALQKGIRDGWLKPHVGASFPLERAAEAHAFIQDRKNIGKVVLTCND